MIIKDIYSNNERKMRRFMGLSDPLPAKLVCMSFILFFVVTSCTKEWDNHFEIKEETVNGSMWDDIKTEPRYSLFTGYMQKYGMDTLFEGNMPHTLFVVPDSTLKAVPDTGSYIPKMLAFHISPTVFLSRNVNSYKKLLTQSGKYAAIQALDGTYLYDGVSIEKESPLYLDGKYYELSDPAIPKPNLYEYTELYSSIIKDYIDLQDSVYLDLEASKPIGFDESGNTIYDSVTSSVNLFEKYYFPVNTEFRSTTASFILFTQDQYIAALDEMAGILGGNFQTHEDIPLYWQYDVLLPEMMKIGLFDNELEYYDLQRDTLKSVTGDTSGDRA